MKCDETRPAPCLRCKKFGSTCDGYPESRHAHTKTQPSILPREVRQHTIRLLTSNPSFRKDEAFYFDYYCNHTALRIGGPFDTNLWLQTVTQVSQESSSIRHAVIALGALNIARSEICQRYGFYDYSKTSNRHHQYALQEYSKALQGMREAIHGPKKDSIQPLIASLLVFCVECLLGHRSAASLHASSAVSLISQLRCKRLEETFAFSGPSPDPLDIELYSAFSNLDLQALLFVDNRPWKMHQDLLTEMESFIRRMPNHFSEIKKCRNYLQIIMRRNLHFVAIARSMMGSGSHQNESRIMDLSEDNSRSERPNGSEGLLTSLLHERESYVKDIQRWECASAGLLADAAIDGAQNFLLSSLLQIHAAMNKVMLSRTFDPSEIATDEYFHEFKTIVDLSYSIKHLLIPLRPTDVDPLFRFDIGILPALSQVGLLCRDQEVRGRAIALLLDNPGYREAVWETDAIGQMCDFVRGIEEACCDEIGFIPGDRRVTMLSVEYFGRSCKAEFMQRTGPCDGDVVVRTACFSW